MVLQVTILDKTEDAKLIDSIKKSAFVKIEPSLPEFKKTYIELDEFEDRMGRKYFRENIADLSKNMNPQRERIYISDSKVESVCSEGHHKPINSRNLEGRPDLAHWDQLEKKKWENLSTQHQAVLKIVKEQITEVLKSHGISPGKVPFHRGDDEDYAYHGGFAGGDLIDELIGGLRLQAKRFQIPCQSGSQNRNSN